MIGQVGSTGRLPPRRLAAGRRARPGRGKLARDAVLREFVQAGLTKRWSPEQICHELQREFPDDPDRQLVHETIYQAIYRPDLGGLRRDLPRLRTGRRSVPWSNGPAAS